MDKGLLTGFAVALGLSGYSLGPRRHYGRPLSRHYRNPSDPVQARRIKAAEDKRKCRMVRNMRLNEPKRLAEPYTLDRMDREIMEQMREEGRHEQDVFRQLRGLVRPKAYRDILEYMYSDSDYVCDLAITDTHGGDEMEFDEYAFKRAYVHQTCNGGYTGDSYAGDVWIPLNAGKYLRFHYAC